MVGLLATGGSTNHAIHLPAIARTAGISIDWADFDELSACDVIIICVPTPLSQYREPDLSFNEPKPSVRKSQAV